MRGNDETAKFGSNPILARNDNHRDSLECAHDVRGSVLDVLPNIVFVHGFEDTSDKNPNCDSRTVDLALRPEARLHFQIHHRLEAKSNADSLTSRPKHFVVPSCSPGRLAPTSVARWISV